jgi:hypothetical protein
VKLPLTPRWPEVTGLCVAFIIRDGGGENVLGPRLHGRETRTKRGRHTAGTLPIGDSSIHLILLASPTGFEPVLPP